MEYRRTIPWILLICISKMIISRLMVTMFTTRTIAQFAYMLLYQQSTHVPDQTDSPRVFVENQVESLSFKIWGTASSNVGDDNLNDLDLELIPHSLVNPRSVSCRACGVDGLYYTEYCQGMFIEPSNMGVMQIHNSTAKDLRQGRRSNAIWARQACGACLLLTALDLLVILISACANDD